MSTANSSSSDRRVLIFTKPARPGRVKTRLIGDLSAIQAAQLHEAFVGDVVEALAGGPYQLVLAWALEEGEEAPRLLDPAGEPVASQRQEGKDLGERLFHGLARSAEEFSFVAALGSDHPTIPRDRLQRAFEALEAGADVALGPASDGGYYLIACSRRGLRRELFTGIAWSTETVLAETLERAESLGLEVFLLPEGHDVDRPADLARLARELAAEPGRCPRTRARLEAWGRLAVEVSP
jgi:rSAM/selenodomain-associated transferase 1